jgi:hypothetical protein
MCIDRSKFPAPRADCSERGNVRQKQRVAGMDRRETLCYRPAPSGAWVCLSGVAGLIAQVVEQLTLNQRVAGSSPAEPTKISAGALQVHQFSICRIDPRRPQGNQFMANEHSGKTRVQASQSRA